MNRKGLSLVELLGAIVILGVLITLLASVFGFYINAQRRISISAQANSEGLLVINVVKTNLNKFTANTYQACSSDNCIIFEKEYEYIYNEHDELIELVTYDEPLLYKISISDNALYINDEIYDFNGFTLTDDSKLTYEEQNGVLNLSIVLYLTDTENDVFKFIINDSILLSEVPS